MSHTAQRNWLVAYDIADPRRLQRVHRYLKRHAIPVQYSVFVLHGNQILLQRVLSGIAELISTQADDVRAYHLPDRCEVTMLGRQSLPHGVMLGSAGLDRLLQELTVGEDRSIVECEANEPTPS
jgi:CRISPR-associated protein Cas2